MIKEEPEITLVPADQAPKIGTFYSLQNIDNPPLPFCPFPDVDIFAIKGGGFLFDDSQIDYPALREAAALEHAVSAIMLSEESQMMSLYSAPPSPGGGGSNSVPQFEYYAPTTNGLRLLRPVLSATNVTLTVAGGTNADLYDLYSTTNLTGSHITNSTWTWKARVVDGGSYALPLENAAQAFYVLGLTNDSDHGGFSDAYEKLVTHGNINNSADDNAPIVRIQVVDSVAIEQVPTNTVKFLLTRSATNSSLPLTVACIRSGTASNGTDYTLSPVQTNPYPMDCAVTFAAGQTNAEITLTAVNDNVTEGTETVTLTLAANWPTYRVDANHASATAYILEEYTKTFTTVADFSSGTRMGLEAAQGTNDGQLQFKTNLPPQFSFINVACSDLVNSEGTFEGRGTVVRINTTNGVVVGEYRTAPAGIQPDPSRTTVDQYGNVWVANRKDTRVANGTTNGSITRIGLIIGGTRFSKTNGVFVADSQGQYMAISNSTYNTCIDRDGDGFIRTSRGLADILPWTNERDGWSDVDSDGGVSTAVDEAITEYTRVPCTGTRTIAVDKFNDIWVGGHTDNQTHLKVNGLLGLSVPGSAFDARCGGYGGVIDRLGNLWSSANNAGNELWLRPPTVFPPVENQDWQPLELSGYGIAVDPLHPYVWQTSLSGVFRWHTNGTLVTNASGVLFHAHGSAGAQGLTVDRNGHIWVAHSNSGSTTVGHLNTNGTLVGVVELNVGGLWAEYFNNTNLTGWPALTNMETGPINYSLGSGWPETPVSTDQFSARWSGILSTPAQGTNVFYVSAEARAAYRLTINGAVIIDNWTSPATNTVELAGTNWMGTNVACDIKLEYIHFTNLARVKLSWKTPGMTSKEVIPLEQFQSANTGPTGVSIDASGKIWAACYNSHTAVRINPDAGLLVIDEDGQTNHVGLADMVVNLGDGTFHAAPYNKPASPYNYSDMTGFNGRVVNPGMQPFKGYWTVIHDSGIAGEWWKRVTWSNSLPEGCAMEVFARAGDDCAEMTKDPFIAVTNNATLTGVKGRFIEVRLALTRDDASKQPVLHDLTLHGSSSGFAGDLFLDDSWAYETEDAWFFTEVAGPEPTTYQWFVRSPWMDGFAPLSGAINSYLQWTNADLWDDWTQIGLSISNATGETLWLGPALLSVYPLSIAIPGTNTSGPASRYPATINVRGEPTNGLEHVEVTLHNLRHAYPADLDILLVSPSGSKIMLMSDAGGSLPVTNATLVFHPASQNKPTPPEQGPIPSNIQSLYSPWNYGDLEPQLPGAPTGPYTDNLDNMSSTDPDPNGIWKLYIYDDKNGQTGILQDSWSLRFFYAP